MYEIMLLNLNKLCDFQLFQVRSTNGMYTLVFDDDIYEIIDFLNDKNYKYINNKVSFDNAIRINHDFFDTKLPLQDVDYLIEEYNLTFKTNPFNIRLNSVENFSPLGKVYYKRYNNSTYFKRIDLDRNLKSNLVSFYAHELVHTQVEKNMYTLLENYFDREFLSIFVELVISEFCNDTYNHNTFEKRLEILKYQFEYYRNNRKDNLVRSYLVSSFKAFHLYDIYLNSSLEIKKEILESVEKVFKEEITIGILLNKYEIDYDNSKKTKYLKKN
jgi:hypothetical protein